MSDATYTYDEVKYLLSAAARTRFRKVFTGAPDVIATLRERIPPAEPDLLYQPGMGVVAQLLAVEITPDESLSPGQFKLVRHSECSVIRSTDEVLHGLCPVIAMGVLVS
jgi:hypothetical protein